jgi:acyl-CoA synthetase (AMP-forming)/AMP-acid ligase II
VKEARTFVEVLQRQAERDAHRRVHTFLVDGETEEEHFTFAELDRRARCIAGLLQERLHPGDRALLLYPPGLEYIAALFGCLYAGAIAVPAYPPRPGRGLARLQAVVVDARPAIALTTHAIGQSLAQPAVAGDALARLEWVSTDDVATHTTDWRQAGMSGDTLALLQYTSGSTGAPKGVMLTHANLLANSALIHWRYDHSAASRGVMWVPPYHDMGLVGGILQPVYGGFAATLLSPLAFLQRPMRWLQAIARTRATTSAAPCFAFDVCVERTTPQQRAGLDLSSWRVAACGAEPIRADVLDRFVDAFTGSGFRREAFLCSFGLAEATLMVTGGSIQEPPVVRTFSGDELARDRAVPAAERSSVPRVLVGCGPTLPGQRVVIVDPATRRARPAGRIGEIWISGPSVAVGYWGRLGATRSTFKAEAVIAGSREGPFLRTGDLGFVDGQGELFVTGRLNDLLFLPGRKLYPEDVELTVANCHSALAAARCVAFTIERAGVQRLAVAAELRRATTSLVDATTIVRAIQHALVADHDVGADAVVLVRPGSLPRTTSGKLQRHACRQAFLAGTLELWTD